MAAFHYPIAYRSGGNEKYHPISVFEFKRPGYFGFINNPKEDPIEQVRRYCSQIKDKGVQTVDGLRVPTDDRTPFYAYIITDMNNDVSSWLAGQKAFKCLADGETWFSDQSADRGEGLNLHIEYMTWQKVVNDAHMKHEIFFKLLKLPSHQIDESQ